MRAVLLALHRCARAIGFDRARRFALAIAIAPAFACDDPPVAPDESVAIEQAGGGPDAGARPEPDETGADDPADPTDEPVANPDAIDPTRPPRTRADLDEPVIERRATTRAAMIYAKPQYDAPFRGKLPRGEAFAIHERVEGDRRCLGDGWARVGIAAYVCLEHSATARRDPAPLPALARGELMPFYYARRSGRGQTRPPAPRWRSKAALVAGEAPHDELELEHDYAFVKRKRARGEWVLVDSAFRVVKERDVRRMKPSDFAGRDVTQDPIPDDRVLAWSVVWRHAIVRDAARVDAPQIAGVPFHETVWVRDEPTSRTGEVFYPRADGDGWLADSEISRFIPHSRPAGVGDDELWLDVELTEQTLAIGRGDAVEFVTLVSTGSPKNPTPIGVYRITSKMAYSDMRSRADEEDPYYVEAVPWVMYFDGRYALHGTFWHNRFGRRTSHGCVNLSASDARRVYDLVAPHAPGGWLSIYQHADDPGTVLRIRKGTVDPPDRRRGARS